MVYVVFDNKNVHRTWHVGEPRPCSISEMERVTEVQADGDELIHIYGMCDNLPSCKGHVVNWFGDHAKFIVANCLR